MRRYLKLTLVIILGLLVGLIIHGVLEILAIWILTTWLNDFFLKVSWSAWFWIHLIFTVIIEILGVILVFKIYKKYEK
ncbi:hypothetical protein KJA15_03675 [Patescibacteria group bacterium]|nr:hypothetical protein [Patescibacteria group bacterium]